MGEEAAGAGPDGRGMSLRAAIMAPFAASAALSVLVLGAAALGTQETLSGSYARGLLAAQAEIARTNLAAFMDAPYRACADAADLVQRLGFLPSVRPEAAQSLIRDFFRGPQGSLDQVGTISIADEGASYAGYRRDPGDRLVLMAKDPTTAGLLAILEGEGRESPVAASYEGYDPRPRPWYAPAAEASAARWSEIYTDYDEKQAVSITISVPVFRGNDFAGVVGYDVKLDAFAAFLADQARSFGGEAFVVDGAGRLIAESGGSPVLADGKGKLPRGERIPASSSGNALVAAAAAAMEEGARSAGYAGYPLPDGRKGKLV